MYNPSLWWIPWLYDG